MRQYISVNLLEQKYINNMVLKHDHSIKLLQESFDKLNTKEKNNHIFFEGQIYDAYSLLLDIFEGSNKSIIIIDNYVDKKLLDVVCKTNKYIIVYSQNMDRELIKKYQSQYHNLVIKNNNSFHDRFILIDHTILYHCGASFKDLGKKCFALNKIEGKEIIDNILSILQI